jgi:hypothetical protein
MIAPTYSFIESDFSSVDEALSAYGARRYEPTPRGAFRRAVRRLVRVGR